MPIDLFSGTYPIFSTEIENSTKCVIHTNEPDVSRACHWKVVYNCVRSDIKVRVH